EELSLGLDSFVFIDDSPMECAEVRSALPEVTVLELPAEAEVPRWLEHLWALDVLGVTAEDRARAAYYAQDAERARMRAGAISVSDFLAELRLEVDCSAARDAQ